MKNMYGENINKVNGLNILEYIDELMEHGMSEAQAEREADLVFFGSCDED